MRHIKGIRQFLFEKEKSLYDGDEKTERRARTLASGILSGLPEAAREKVWAVMTGGSDLSDADLKKKLVSAGLPVGKADIAVKNRDLVVGKAFAKVLESDAQCEFVNCNDEEYEIIPEKLAELLGFVGDGVYGITVESHDANHNGSAHWTNTVTVQFEEAAHGNIELADWRKAENILSKCVGRCGVSSVNVKASHNKIEIEFEQDRPLVGRDWYRQ